MCLGSGNVWGSSGIVPSGNMSPAGNSSKLADFKSEKDLFKKIINVDNKLRYDVMELLPNWNFCW